MEEVLEEAAKKINMMQRYQSNAKRKILMLRELKLKNEDFCIKVGRAKLNGKIAAVDSGFVVKNFYYVDLLFVKARAAIFEYNENELKNATFFPELEIMPKPVLLGHSLERDELNAARSLYRLKEEIALANEVLEKFRPRILLLDGSIVPQNADKPRADSELRETYKKLIKMFENLYENAERGGCILVGVIEDSRGARLKKIVEKLIGTQLMGFSDVGMANVLLKENERTLAFKYSDENERHYILADFKEKWRSKISAFYLKPSERDLPIRIEFINNKQNLADKIASIILSLSSFHKEYAYPNVLIEADMRARLRPQEIEMVLEGLTKRIKGEFALMRRERRPFL